jgi:hypothetical protein
MTAFRQLAFSLAVALAVVTIAEFTIWLLEQNGWIPWTTFDAVRVRVKWPLAALAFGLAISALSSPSFGASATW